ncbi:MAG: helix-turn-helix domain-containing protein [Dehalococcoidia bacterium]
MEGHKGWDKDSVKSLRRHLEMTQQELARELGARQQTVSEWERGIYAPRGTSARLLSIIAERAEFEYRAESPSGRGEEGDEQGGG